MLSDLKEIIEVLEKCQKPIICMDSRVDFDAICSCIIFYDYLHNILRKEVFVTLDGEIPDYIRKETSKFGSFDFVTENICPIKDIDYSNYDLQIFLDSGNIEHICKDNSFTPLSNITKLNIDHHAGNNNYGDYNFVKQYTSACTVLYYFFKEASIEINKSLASIYYLGMILDSGFFQYNTVKKEDFLMCSELFDMGAQCYQISWDLTFNQTLDSMKLKGLVFDNLKILPDKKVAYSVIRNQEVLNRGIDDKKVNIVPSDEIKTLEGVDYVFVIREREDSSEKGNFNISFRSHEANYDVLSVAKLFGGNGHKMAAGAIIQADSMEEAIKKVLDTINKT